MNGFVHHMGSVWQLARILGHYRLMQRTDRTSAGFWRMRARVVIAEYREQIAQPERLAA